MQDAELERANALALGRINRYALLLHEARDLLWHNPGHLLGGVTDCPGCALEASIDEALGRTHTDGQEAP